MVLRRPADAIVPSVVGGSIAVALLYGAMVTGNPRAQAVAFGVAASLAFTGVLAAAVYFRLRWSGLKSVMTAVGWYSLSVGCLLLLVNAQALWIHSALLVGFSIFLLGVYNRRWV